MRAISNVKYKETGVAGVIVKYWDNMYVRFVSIKVMLVHNYFCKGCTASINTNLIKEYFR